MTASRRSRRNTFAASGLERAAERRGDRAWLASLEQSADARFLVVDGDGRLLADARGRAPRWLDAAQRAQWFPDCQASLLGLSGETAHFLIRDQAGRADAIDPGQATARISLRTAGNELDAFEAGLCAYACGLAHWQAGMRFCNVCGARVRLIDAGHRAQCISPDCGRLHFPRTDPAIIVIVEHEGACLLGRQASWPEGRYSTLAGFVEPGEALEDAVRREVAEEAGVEVIECDYHSSQPWPFPASLMLGFTARAAGRELELRDGELEHARWFTPEQIVAGVRDGSLKLSSSLSVSWHLLDHWMRERAGVALESL